MGHGAETPMPTFLFVPGAWLGGWCWRDVAANLRASGHTVLCPTLTGLGERAHLLSPEILLETHVADIAGLFHYRDLSGVTLVGHSYGGTIITAVAERVPRRIRRLVYLDASVPQDGESNNDVIGATMAAQLRSSAMSGGDGWRVPPADYVVARLPERLQPWVEERLTPHPLRPFDDPVHLASPAAAALPRAFVRSTRSDLYDRLIDRARKAGWYCREIGGGHYPMFTEPDAVSAALKELPG
jgi:pimeloyl-ACP methyl ester carboxylesterase